MAPQHVPERPAVPRDVLAVQLLAGSGTNTISFLNAAGFEIDEGATGLSSPHPTPEMATDARTTANMRRVIGVLLLLENRAARARRLCESGALAARRAHAADGRGGCRPGS
jgi:hypothetical protein